MNYMLHLYCFKTWFFLECNCHKEGSESFICNWETGECDCKPNVVGKKCGECEHGHYRFPDCEGKEHVIFHLFVFSLHI